jgi:hypothetical protein
VALPDDDPVDRSRLYRTQTLSQLSDLTGGAPLTASNAFDELFERIVADNTMYYLLGFNSSAADGKRPRRLKVTVDRPGVAVQVRSSIGSRPPGGDRDSATRKRRARLGRNRRRGAWTKCDRGCHHQSRRKTQ